MRSRILPWDARGLEDMFCCSLPSGEWLGVSVRPLGLRQKVIVYHVVSAPRSLPLGDSGSRESNSAQAKSVPVPSNSRAAQLEVKEAGHAVPGIAILTRAVYLSRAVPGLFPAKRESGRHQMTRRFSLAPARLFLPSHFSSGFGNRDIRFFEWVPEKCSEQILGRQGGVSPV